MKTIYKFQTAFLMLVLVFSPLIFNACSTDDTNSENSNNNDNSNSEVMPSPDPPNDVFIVNMNASSVGDRASILGCNRLPIQNDMYLRDSLGLENEMFFGIYGKNFNTDGSVPQGLNDIGGPFSNLRGNKMSLTFILKNDETANAELVVKDPIDGEFTGVPGFGCGDPSFELSKFDCEFRVLEEGSNALGGFNTINYSFGDTVFFGDTLYRLTSQDNNEQFGIFSEYLSALSVQDTVIKVRILETVRIEGEERIVTFPDLE